jgi:lycopene beta-cyclase
MVAQNRANLPFRVNNFQTKVLLTTMNAEKYAIIIAGGGLSGLTLAVELAGRPFFRKQKILLIDREPKTKNDRTWCFWAQPSEPLPPVLYKTWDRCHFYGENFEDVLELAPYRYCMIRGIDFYRWAASEIEKADNIECLTAEIRSIDAASGVVHTNGGPFQADWVLNSALGRVRLHPEPSALYPTPPLSLPTSGAAEIDPGYTFFLQHFKGQIIESASPAFDPGIATLMDYRIDQKGETRFVYVLPFSATRALVEFTVFSPALCLAEEYDAALQHYIHHFLKIGRYTVEETEFGVIPMTDHPFRPAFEGRVLNIGALAGFVKPSSGYAFLRTQRRLRAFADRWEKTGAPDARVLSSPLRYRFYDSVLLQVLKNGQISGKTVFSRLFSRLPAPEVFRFLDEDTRLWQDIRLMHTVPKSPFLWATGQRLGRRL